MKTKISLLFLAILCNFAVFAQSDFNTYFASYVEHEVGISNQLYRAETRTGEPSSSTTFNNVWENTYSVLKNARIIVHKW